MEEKEAAIIKQHDQIFQTFLLRHGSKGKKLGHLILAIIFSWKSMYNVTLIQGVNVSKPFSFRLCKLTKDRPCDTCKTFFSWKPKWNETLIHRVKVFKPFFLQTLHTEES